MNKVTKRRYASARKKIVARQRESVLQLVWKVAKKSPLASARRSIRRRRRLSGRRSSKTNKMKVTRWNKKRILNLISISTGERTNP